MPAIPLIERSTDVGGLPPQPHLDPGSYAALSTSGLRAVGGAVGAIAESAEAARRAEEISKRELAQLDLERAGVEMKRQYAEGVDQLKNDPTVTTENYVENVNRLGDSIVAGVSKTLRDPARSHDRFQLLAQRQRIEAEIDARTYNRQRLVADVVAQTGMAGQADRREAVFATNPDGTDNAGAQEAAVARFQTRVTNLVDRGFISGPAGNQMRVEFMKDVTRGRTERDFLRGDATVKNAVIADLRAGKMEALDPAEQLTLAAQLEHREQLALDAQDRATEQARKTKAGEADKRLTDLMDAGDFTGAKGVLAEARTVMEPTQYHTWSERIAKGPVKITDPAAKNYFVPLVYNAQNNPLVVDKELRAAYGRGLVAEDDMKAWGGHLETRITRLENRNIAAASRRTAEQARDDALLAREQSDIEQQLVNVTRVNGPAADVLDAVAQDAYNDGLADLHRNVYQRQQRPYDWWIKKRPEIQARIATVGGQRLRSLDQDLLFKTPETAGATGAAVAAGTRALEANKSKIPEHVYLGELRKLKEKQSLITNMEKWGTLPPSAGTRPAAQSGPAVSGQPGSPAAAPGPPRGGEPSLRMGR